MLKNRFSNCHQQLPSAIASNERRAAELLGQLFDVVRVYRVVPPGMERGYHELRFRLSAWRIIQAAIGGKLPDSLLSCVGETELGAGDSPEFCLVVRARPSEGGNTDQVSPPDSND